MSDPTPLNVSRTTRDWLFDSALEPIAAPYAALLTKRGYAAATIRNYLGCIAHFGHYLASQRIALADIDDATVATFLDGHLLECHCAKRCRGVKYEVRAALGHLLALLRTEELIGLRPPVFPVAITAELENFDAYLAEVRGLQPITRRARRQHVSAFLVEHFAQGAIDLRRLRPSHVERFMMTFTARWKPASANQVCISLRSYLRFKVTSGIDTTALITALPHVAQWRMAGLPRDLSAEEVTKLMGAFDQRTTNGLRDYAIALCYLDLGLRTTEIVRLKLADIDWQQGTVRVRGKGQRTDQLPLPATTGRAVIAYLRKGRRQTPSRALFLRHRPPHDEPATPETVRGAIRSAAQRCGLAARVTGTHVLRHTFACRLVRNGASLKVIADLLRHRSLDTTTIYAKVDLDALATIAAPWPEAQA
jgi:site-specific recombinase XerD